jgi:multimeric flavodoxin WrbA
MKVLAINSSSRSDNISKTKLMLNHLTKGMIDTGADVEIIDLRNKNIKYCIGCYSCWHKTPGKCALNDDMTNELFSKWEEADIVVYASPLFCHHMNAVMTTFQERLLPITLPCIEKKGDKSTLHHRSKLPKIVILSVCGFPDISEFNLLSNYMKYSCDNYLIAEIYRSASGSMQEKRYKQKLDDILNAAEQAGKELIISQKINPETLKRITQPIGDYDVITNRINKHWEEIID